MPSALCRLKHTALSLVVAAAAPLSGAFAHAEAPTPIFDGRAAISQADPPAAEVTLLERAVRPEARAAWRGKDKDGCTDEFTVLDRVSGAFTRAGAKESAVLYDYCNIGRQNGMAGIAVLSAGCVVAHVVWEGGGERRIVALPDVNQDGLSEIAVSSGGSGQGTAEEGIAVIELGASGVQKLGTFSTFSDNCGVDETGGTEHAAAISAIPGSTPRFFAERYVKPCDGGRWRTKSARAPVVPRKDGVNYWRLR